LEFILRSIVVTVFLRHPSRQQCPGKAVTGEVDALTRGIEVRQGLSAKLNLLNRHWGQYEQPEKNEHKASLPFLWPQAPQVDAYSADRRAEKAYH
jgi:hypothetical protein